MNLINIACGDRYHQDWINIDYYSTDAAVKTVNILKGLPFEENFFGAAYAGHFLEHLTRTEADSFLEESLRVLKPGGLLRLVVPDLENICREYLNIIDNINEQDAQKKHLWITMELIDQLVRTSPGGEMELIYRSEKVLNDTAMKAYIKKRVGVDLDANCHRHRDEKRRYTLPAGRIANRAVKAYTNILKALFPRSVRRSLVLDTAVGERHLWMYDRYSLEFILKAIGFKAISFMNYNQSNIPHFNSYLLDMNQDGSPYKGVSSLYCEALKP